MNEERLPAAFTAAMKEMLGQEADAFLHSYSLPRTQSLRFNTLKASTPEPLLSTPSPCSA